MKMVCLWREKSSLIDICRGTQTMQLNTRGKHLQQIRKPSMLQITDSKTVLGFFFLHLRKRGGGHQSSSYYSPSCFDLNLRIGIKVTRFEQWNKNKTLAVELNEALCAGWAPSPGHCKLNPPDKELFLIAC